MNLYLRHLDNSKGDKMGGMGKMMNGAGQAQDASQNLTTEETAEVNPQAWRFECDSLAVFRSPT